MGRAKFGVMMVCSSTKEKTFISSGFDELILYDPARVDEMHSCSALKIVTAFTDCDRISTHMIIFVADGK